MTINVYNNETTTDGKLSIRFISEIFRQNLLETTRVNFQFCLQNKKKATIGLLDRVMDGLAS